jgi:Flp pilus assembly protein TadD
LRPNESSLFNNLGVSLLLKGDYEEAVGSFNEALKFETNSDKVHNNLALALCKLGRYPEAIEVFKKGGSEASAYNNVGYVFLMEGNYQKAMEAFERSLEINPGFYVRAYENLNKAKTAYTPPSQK